jgi:hypothetical protein
VRLCYEISRKFAPYTGLPESTTVSYSGFDCGSENPASAMQSTIQHRGFSRGAKYRCFAPLPTPGSSVITGQSPESHLYFAVSGEIWRFTQPFLRSNAVGNLWAISYTARRNLVFDAGFEKGLTSTSTQWEGFVGFTYLLPDRLW